MSYITFRYKVEALDFILKDNPYQMQNRICECIENVHTVNKAIVFFGKMKDIEDEVGKILFAAIGLIW